MTNIYQTVYEAGELSFPGALLILWGIVLILTCILVAFRKRMRVFGLIAVVFFIAMFGYMGVNALTDRVRQKKCWEAYSQGNCFVSEGEISYFNETGIEKQGQDSFFVGQERFQTGFVTGYGYKITKLGGGALDDGVKVRITYMPSGLDNVIMKLEIAE